jgi:hypothetical protein
MIKSIVIYLIDKFLPYHTLVNQQKHISKIKNLNDIIERQSEDIKLLSSKVYSLERDIETQLKYIEYIKTKNTLPKNFDVLINGVNELTSKARATLLFRLVNGIDEESLNTLDKYLYLRLKENKY